MRNNTWITLWSPELPQTNQYCLKIHLWRAGCCVISNVTVFKAKENSNVWNQKKIHFRMPMKIQLKIFITFSLWLIFHAYKSKKKVRWLATTRNAGCRTWPWDNCVRWGDEGEGSGVELSGWLRAQNVYKSTRHRDGLDGGSSMRIMAKMKPFVPNKTLNWCVHTLGNKM